MHSLQTTDNLLNEVHQRMEKAVEFIVNELRTIHTGKASPSMVETIMVKIPSYGSTMKLKEIAAITTPDARTISIQPWDKGIGQEIVKAIQSANVGLNPVAAGDNIRCPIPDLSRERRQELVKTTHSMAEEGRVRIRGIRREAIDVVKKEQKEGKISEDDLKRFEKEIQTQTDKQIKKIEAHLADKEKELMQI